MASLFLSLVCSPSPVPDKASSFSPHYPDSQGGGSPALGGGREAGDKPGMDEIMSALFFNFFKINGILFNCPVPSHVPTPWRGQPGDRRDEATRWDGTGSSVWLLSSLPLAPPSVVCFIPKSSPGTKPGWQGPASMTGPLGWAPGMRPCLDGGPTFLVSWLGASSEVVSSGPEDCWVPRAHQDRGAVLPPSLPCSSAPQAGWVRAWACARRGAPLM